MNTFWIIVSTVLVCALIVLTGLFLFLVAWLMERDIEKSAR